MVMYVAIGVFVDVLAGIFYKVLRFLSILLDEIADISGEKERIAN